MTKFIFVTGGVVSSLGKGITGASLGRLLKDRGFSVRNQKLDPYINVDAGTISPYQHGEVYVTEDGAETDLDLGHYERFVDTDLSKASSTTTGKIYWHVLNKERHGEFDGGTVQVIPHITNEIQESILTLAQEHQPDFVISEIGGTVGDIESLPFLEAVRQIKNTVGRKNIIYIHVTLIPYVKTASELKTKPTQHSVNELRRIGIQPDIIVCRSERPLTKEVMDKVSLFCDIEPEAVIPLIDVDNIYQIPMVLRDDNLDKIVLEKFEMPLNELDLSEWETFYEKAISAHKPLKVALIGKYIELPDAYLSLTEALKHSAIYHDAKLDLQLLSSSDLTEENIVEKLQDMDGIVVPAGFGHRGTKGKMLAVDYAKRNNIPFLGIGMGMHLAILDAAIKEAGLEKATMPELGPSNDCCIFKTWRPVREGEKLGGTLCLGSYPIKVEPNSLAEKVYGGKNIIHERHRHRYVFDNQYLEALKKTNLKFSGKSVTDDIVEIVELPDHPWFMACQYHPEFKSRPMHPHPLTHSFITAALENKK